MATLVTAPTLARILIPSADSPSRAEHLPMAEATAIIARVRRLTSQLATCHAHRALA